MKAASLHFQNIAFLFLKYFQFSNCSAFYEITFFLMGIYMQFGLFTFLKDPLCGLRLLHEGLLTWSLPMLPNIEHASHFFVHFFLHFSFSRTVHATVFTKPAVTRDLIDIHTSASACWKDNELQNTCASSEFR